MKSNLLNALLYILTKQLNEEYEDIDEHSINNEQQQDTQILRINEVNLILSY